MSFSDLLSYRYVVVLDNRKSRIRTARRLVPRSTARGPPPPPSRDSSRHGRPLEGIPGAAVMRHPAYSAGTSDLHRQLPSGTVESAARPEGSAPERGGGGNTRAGFFFFF